MPPSRLAGPHPVEPRQPPHGEPLRRPVTWRSPARARLAAMMLLTLRGTPFIYYGEEIGMADTPIPPERVVDVAGRDPESARRCRGTLRRSGRIHDRGAVAADGRRDRGGQRRGARRGSVLDARLLPRRHPPQAVDAGASQRFVRDSGRHAGRRVRLRPRGCRGALVVALNFGRSSVAVAPPGEGTMRISTDPARLSASPPGAGPCSDPRRASSSSSTPPICRPSDGGRGSAWRTDRRRRGVVPAHDERGTPVVSLADETGDCGPISAHLP